mmetsp:Transcript_92684/g.239329  ORF Transcript_92684/g.239329 Transcript_92684/m.239329 type:complete len:309 (+) Transcript_92684:391-1317(+)
MHLEVRLLAITGVLEDDERVLQGVAGLPVAHDLAALDGAEAREDQLQVAILCDGIELVDEEVVVRRRDVGVGQVVQQLQRRGLALGERLRHLLLQLGLVLLVLDLLVGLVLDDFRRVRRYQRLQAGWVWERVVQDLRVPDPDSLERRTLVVDHDHVHSLQHLMPLCDSAEDGVLAVEVLHFVAERHVELRPVVVRLLICHGHSTQDVVLELRGDLILEVLLSPIGQLGVDGHAARARVRRVAGLRDEVLLHRVEEAVVVVLQLAQLDEVRARLWSMVNLEVDDQVANGRLEEHRHPHLSPRRIQGARS